MLLLLLTSDLAIVVQTYQGGLHRDARRRRRTGALLNLSESEKKNPNTFWFRMVEFCLFSVETVVLDVCPTESNSLSQANEKVVQSQDVVFF